MRNESFHLQIGVSTACCKDNLAHVEDKEEELISWKHTAN